MANSLKDELKDALKKIEQGAKDALKYAGKEAGGVEREVTKEFETKPGEQQKQ